MLSEEMNIGETVGQAGSSDMPVDVSGAAEAVESFEELLEKSIKTLNTGEKVTGIVAAITPTEISVDSVQSSRVTYP